MNSTIMQAGTGGFEQIFNNSILSELKSIWSRWTTGEVSVFWNLSYSVQNTEAMVAMVKGEIRDLHNHMLCQMHIRCPWKKQVEAARFSTRDYKCDWVTKSIFQVKNKTE